MKGIIGAAGLAIALGAGPGVAATLTATSSGIVPIGDFTIEFDDLNGNSLFDINEFLSMSPFVEPFGATLVALLAVPEIAGISVAGSVPGATVDEGSEWWNFETEGSVDLQWNFAAAPSVWTYEITDLVAPVPLPASLPLLLAGLGGLALLRRRAG